MMPLTFHSRIALPKKITLAVCAVLIAGLTFGCASNNTSNSRPEAGPRSSSAPLRAWINSTGCTHRFIIVPEGSSSIEAKAAADHFGGIAWGESHPASPVEAGLQHTLGAMAPRSWGMVRGLTEQLQEINASKTNWQIYLYPASSRLLRLTLNSMPEPRLADAAGTVHLLKSKADQDLEKAVSNASNGRFKVVYEN